MSTALSPQRPLPVASGQQRRVEGVLRFVRFTLLRGGTLFIAVVIGVYLTVLIANMGGYVDEIRRGQIREMAAFFVSMDPDALQLTPEERAQAVAEHIRIQEERLGLNRPFVVRSFLYLKQALTLDLGLAEQITSDSGSRQVRLVLLERLVPTLLLFATSQLFLFFLTLFVALVLSRRYGSLLDRVIVALSPSSAAPSWFYGLFLILIFAALVPLFPFGGMVAAPPPPGKLAYGLSVLKHMVLPVTAIVLSSIFQTIYSWRTFFLIYSSEEYVEMAKAKGLSSRAIEHRYILRPTLPTIVTSFVLTIITLWQGSIILETVFSWPGLGRVLVQAIGVYDTPVIVGSTVIYAYLLALSVLVLDIVYALVDPRVRVEVGR